MSLVQKEKPSFENGKTDLMDVIKYNKSLYKLEEDDPIKMGHLAFYISRLYYKMATHLKGDSPEIDYSRDLLYKSNATWLERAYIHGKPAAHHLFYLAINHKDDARKPHLSYQLEKVKKLNIPLTDESKESLLSYALNLGETATCWTLSQAIEYPENAENVAPLRVLEKHKIPNNTMGQYALLTAASLGGHISASKKLYHRIQSEEITQPLLDKLYEHTEKCDPQISELQKKAISLTYKDSDFRNNFLCDYDDGKLNLIKRQALCANKMHKFMHARLVDTFKI